jgi:hypothetical protein
MEIDSQQLLKDAQKAFLIASTKASIKDVERFAMIGRDYLRRAQTAAKAQPVLPIPSIVE